MKKFVTTITSVLSTIVKLLIANNSLLFFKKQNIIVVKFWIIFLTIVYFGKLYINR